MRILLVHGIGHSDAIPNYYAVWEEEITTGLRLGGFSGPIDFVEFHYDDLFEQHYVGPGTYAAALGELAGSAAWHWVSDPIGNLFRPSRGFFNPYGDTDFRWKAGMVAQFAIEEELKAALRERLASVVSGGGPKFDVIAAHSLGTLVTYDFFRHHPQADKALEGGVYLTFGSQINNDFVRSRAFPGTITVPNVRSWFHLFNDQDPVFTAPIRLSDQRFRQVETSSPSGHSAVITPAGPGYLDHPNTQATVWSPIATQATAPTLAGARVMKKQLLKAPASVTEKPQRRALIIGINEYPDPANRLEGCVNDAFLMSEVLQERGFAAENIRMVLNDRATADAIRERLAWLLYRADDGMERVLFYSGHGAQMPGYNANEEVDHLDECLVPWDFDWTEKNAITDKDFYRLYSDLPLGARFFAMFDCCHSGGLTREGARKARAIDPPDDIRHRMLRWDVERQMWFPRDLPAINPDFGGSLKDKHAYMGSNCSTYKIGRAMRLRRTPKAQYDKLPKTQRGPYLPVLLEACAEGELAYEYKHGATSYGAFTYSLAHALRTHTGVTFLQLVTTANETLAGLGYDQHSQIIGPSVIVKGAVPGGYRVVSPKSKKPVRSKKK